MIETNTEELYWVKRIERKEIVEKYKKEAAKEGCTFIPSAPWYFGGFKILKEAEIGMGAIKNQIHALCNINNFYWSIVQRTVSTISKETMVEGDPELWECPICDTPWESTPYFECKKCGHKDSRYYDYRYSSISTVCEITKNKEALTAYENPTKSKEIG